MYLQPTLCPNNMKHLFIAGIVALSTLQSCEAVNLDDCPDCREPKISNSIQAAPQEYLPLGVVDYFEDQIPEYFHTYGDTTFSINGKPSGKKTILTLSDVNHSTPGTKSVEAQTLWGDLSEPVDSSRLNLIATALWIKLEKPDRNTTNSWVVRVNVRTVSRPSKIFVGCGYAVGMGGQPDDPSLSNGYSGTQAMADTVWTPYWIDLKGTFDQHRNFSWPLDEVYLLIMSKHDGIYIDAISNEFTSN